MNWILAVLAVIMGVCLLVTVLIAVFNPVVFKMAIRNPPRRKTQSLLIVFGLMLSTLIISSALATGDTLDYSIKKITFDSLGPVDQTIAFVGDAGGDGTLSSTGEPIPVSLADELSQRFADDPDIASIMPVLTEEVPAINEAARLSEPQVVVAGLDWAKVEQVGGIGRPGGGTVELGSISPCDLDASPVTCSAVVSDTLADDLGAEVGSQFTTFIRGQQVLVDVAAIGNDSLLTGLIFGQNGPTNHGFSIALSDLQQLTGLEGQARYLAVTNHGGIEGAVSHAAAAETKLREALEGQPYGVNPVKANSVEAAEFAGSTFTSLFLVLGLFSIAAGILLIFLIFMMLAAERRSEMGMARAVGMRQGQLVQQFLAEGTVYDLGAALVGALLGVVVALAMVSFISQVVGEFLSISFKFTWRSVAVAYCLGVTVTFITIIFASVRAARLNIVAAIRDTPDIQVRGTGRPPFRLRNLRPILFWKWVFSIIGYYNLWGPLLTPIGALLMWWGYSREGESWSLALYSLGLSIFALGLMLILRRWLPQRIVFTVISGILLLWWLTPSEGILSDIFSVITPQNLEGDFEMFFISGIMMVTFATLLIMWNAEVIVWIVGLFGKAFARWLPAVKTAVAYPLASKTKTGLTLAMFSLIVFSLVTMSTINTNFEELFTTDAATGGWDVQVVTNPNNPIENLREAVAGSDVPLDQFTAVGSISLITADSSQLREAGEEKWKRTPLNGVDPEYAENTVMPIKVKAPGYESDADVWNAIATDPNVAVIDIFSAGSGGGFGVSDESFVLGLDTAMPTMEPIEVQLSNPGNGETRTIQIIGVIDDEISTVFGLYMNEQTILDLYGTPDGNLTYVQLTDRSYENAKEVAKQIEAALLPFGAQAESTEEQLRTQSQVSTGFIRLIQGFMGLGLLVGIAALGVIAFRAVVERRQQIGMLRAIGFQRNMVAATFLLESLVVAVLGVLTGVVLGLILARNLITSPDFDESASFENFIVPWGTIGLMVLISLVAAALMTIIPSRNAAKVPVAEALRYE
jgi:putative ABC transport system permease protein